MPCACHGRTYGDSKRLISGELKSVTTVGDDLCDEGSFGTMCMLCKDKYYRRDVSLNEVRRCRLNTSGWTLG